MWSIIWRLVAIGVGLLFVMFPIVNLVAIPIELYLVFSLYAIVRRRHAAPLQPDELTSTSFR